MSHWNRAFAAVSLAACLAVPAFADGTPGKPFHQGPEPVEPDQPVLVQPAPVEQSAIEPGNETAEYSDEIKLDLSGFSGGVGHNIGGRFHGGYGNTRRLIVISGDKRFSGVRSHRAAAFTFQGG